MRPLRTLFLASILFSLHAALLAYVHSSMLSAYVSEETIGICFSASSVLSLVLLFIAPKLEKKFGPYKILVHTLIVSLVFLFAIAFTKNTYSIVFFVCYFALNTTVWYNFNLLVEHFATSKTMGGLRGMYLTTTNLAWVGAPSIAGVLITRGGIQAPYIFAMIPILLSVLLLLRYKKLLGNRERPHKSHDILEAFRILYKKVALRKILVLTWILQIFFSIMALFMAPYLRSLGLNWSHIGLVFSIMLIPFVLFELPVGRYLDRSHNEKGVLVFGFALMALAVVYLLVPLYTSWVYFAIVLFVSRIGASIVEVTTDSYFFRHINEHDVGLAGLYQSTIPLGYLVGPFFGGLLLAFGGFHLLFTFLTAGLLLTAIYASSVK